MTRPAYVVALIACIIGTACTHGTKAEDYPPAIGPDGATIAVRVSGENADRIGELLASDSSGISLMGATIVRISWSRVSAIDVDKISRAVDLARGGKVTPALITHLALISRFPQGLNGDLLASVLRLRRQESLEIVQ